MQKSRDRCIGEHKYYGMNLTQVPISMIDTVAGDAGKVLTSNGSTLSWTASSAIAPSTGVAAWVNFDGTKDTTGAASTANTNRLIRASSNVTSVLRNGTGNYTINFTTPMVDANYAITGSCLGGVSGAQYGIFGGKNAGTSNTRSVNSVQVTIGYVSGLVADGTLMDHPDISAAIFR